MESSLIKLLTDHGAWRTHRLETASDFGLRPHRFIHFEADREYYRVGEQDYLSGEQQIALAIYRSTVRQVTKEWVLLDPMEWWAKAAKVYSSPTPLF